MNFWEMEKELLTLHLPASVLLQKGEWFLLLCVDSSNPMVSYKFPHEGKDLSVLLDFALEIGHPCAKSMAYELSNNTS